MIDYSDNPATVAFDLLNRWAEKQGLKLDDTNLQELQRYYEEEVEYKVNRLHRGTKE